jgi:hypothetical protein
MEIPLTGKNPLTMLVLVPHRDCNPALRDYSERLFGAGIDGAYSFPAVSPLALLSRALEKDQLKALAGELRARLGNVKFQGGAPAVSRCVPSAPPEESSAPEFRLYGPALLLPALPVPGLLCRWEPPVLAAALLAPGDGQIPLSPPPELSFRAAALANLVLIPLDAGEPGYSWQWETGRLFWLPKPKKPRVQWRSPRG